MHHVPLLQLIRTTALQNQWLLAFYLAAKDSTNLYVDVTLKLKSCQSSKKITYRFSDSCWHSSSMNSFSFILNFITEKDAVVPNMISSIYLNDSKIEIFTEYMDFHVHLINNTAKRKQYDPPNWPTWRRLKSHSLRTQRDWKVYIAWTREHVYWSGITAEIKDMVSICILMNTTSTLVNQLYPMKFLKYHWLKLAQTSLNSTKNPVWSLLIIPPSFSTFILSQTKKIYYAS